MNPIATTILTPINQKNYVILKNTTECSSYCILPIIQNYCTHVLQTFLKVYGYMHGTLVQH